MKHFLFLYSVLSCVIGLPSMMVLAFAYLKTRKKYLLYLFAFLLLATVQIAYQTYVTYHFINVDYWFTFYDDFMNYIFFGFIIILAPLLINEWFDVPFRFLVNKIFALLSLASQTIVFTLFLTGALKDRYLNSMPHAKIIWGLLILAVIYVFYIIVARFSTFKDSQDRLFLVISAVCFSVEVHEIVQPTFPTFLPQFVVFNFVYFIWNLALLKFVIGKYLLPTIADRVSLREIINRLNLTEREKEIVLLLAQGQSNNKIGAQLFISEETVKTHVKNIYKKLEVNNRVQLVNLLKTEES